MQSKNYRPDIDGLRALAIAPVVWFHSGLGGLSGGFTGVDTFFVISGYLITLIIHREVAEGSFSFARFYERRVRRIAPALLVVTAATLIVGWLILLPYEYDALGRSAVAALTMTSNIFFWREGGYFALSESITPLLHTWSLGVEEQFYLLFPLCLIAAERVRLVRPAILALALISFVLCIAGTARAPGATFYLLPTRGWELMLGAMLAVGVVRIPDRARDGASVVGLLLLVASAFLLTKDASFPGWRATIPAFGALLLIGSGPGSVGSSLLSLPALVGLGRISYSLYLWHWPIFAFLRHYRADLDLPPAWAAGGIVAALGLSILTYHWIEQPARRRSTAYRTVLVSSGLGGAAVLGAGLFAAFTGGFPARLPPAVVAIAKRHDDFDPSGKACVNMRLDELRSRCHLGIPGRPRFVVWGDSHAAADSEGVAAGMGTPGILAAMNSCVPATDWVSPRLPGIDGQICRRRNREILNGVLEDPALSTVVLVAYWPAQEAAVGDTMWASVQNLVNVLRKHDKRVLLLAGTPDPKFDVPWSNAIRKHFGRSPLKLACNEARIPVSGVTLVDISGQFCGGRPAETLLVDANHSSRLAGKIIIAPAVRAAAVASD